LSAGRVAHPHAGESSRLGADRRATQDRAVQAIAASSRTSVVVAMSKVRRPTLLWVLDHPEILQSLHFVASDLANGIVDEVPRFPLAYGDLEVFVIFALVQGSNNRLALPDDVSPSIGDGELIAL
jgi:hypothetical protein